MFLPSEAISAPRHSAAGVVLSYMPPEKQNGGCLKSLISAISRICRRSWTRVNNWAQSLSLGEQQRIAFARILLQRPDYMFLDEATASLDEEMEATLYRLIRSRLGYATVISAGHRTLCLLGTSRV